MSWLPEGAGGVAEYWEMTDPFSHQMYMGNGQPHEQDDITDATPRVHGLQDMMSGIIEKVSQQGVVNPEDTTTLLEILRRGTNYNLNFTISEERDTMAITLTSKTRAESEVV